MDGEPGGLWFTGVFCGIDRAEHRDRVLTKHNKTPTKLKVHKTLALQHLPTMQETQVQSPGREAPLEGRAPHSSALAWRVPRTEESGGLQSMGSHRVGHD